MIDEKFQNSRRGKHLVAVFLAFLMLFMVISVNIEGIDDTNVSSADDYEYYKTGDGKVSVSGLKNTSVTVIDIPETVVISSVSYKVTGIMYNAFMNKTGITSVSIPNSITAIGQSAFAGCSGITKLTIGNGVTSIESSAFIRCTNVISLKFNAKECTIGDSAFSRFGTDGAGVAVSFGDDVEHIPSGIFNNSSGSSSNIVSVTMGKNVKSIGDSAFNKCTKLESIAIPDSVKTIGKNTFADCSALRDITIGKGVESIGETAFFGCKILMNLYFDATDCNVPIGAFLAVGNSGTGVDIRFGDSVKKIPDNIFYTSSPTATTCAKIKSVTIGNNVEIIGERAFCNIIGLRDLVIGESVKTIGLEAFRNCNQLEYLFIPGSVTSIGDRAFSLCSSLKYINIGGLTDSVSIGIDVFTYEGEYAYQFFNVKSKDHIEFNSDNVKKKLFSNHSYFSSGIGAGFLAQRCEITLEPNGGTCGPSIILTDTNGAIEGILPTPTRDGYTFKGWYYVTGEVTQSTLFTENVTISAKWEEISHPSDPGSNSTPYIGIGIAIAVLLLLVGLYVWKKQQGH